MKLEQLLGNQLYYRAEESRLRNLIYEGLIKSYPMHSVIAFIKSAFNINCSTLRKDKQKLYNCFALDAKIEQIDFDKLLVALNRDGWYIAFINLYSNKELKIKLEKNITADNIDKAIKEFNCDYFAARIEAKYDVEIERKFWPKELYCVAPFQVKNKIEKIGLVPKSGKNLDNQPERIYMGIYKDELINHMLPQLKQKDNRYKEGTILITLNTSEFPENVRLFDDINFPDGAVYTLVNIPPKCITEIKDI